ncbi:MAG: Multicopper oxidase [uncultured Thermomicrobiales bacterium]|uniref:Multicopper oxidase n=1 Tax=uncultured Thermomicrobiales bacterium TaxID=1645740 RepID=A0A6J4UWD7_9BACT|nr:MAG: Multicopper oxidase [uncultured Thermomicrobiales bacterium]
MHQFDTLKPLGGGNPRRRARAVPLALLLGLVVLVAGMAAGRRIGLTRAEAPPAETREFALITEEIDWTIMPGVAVRAWAYNGQVPGPEIRVREGDRVRITLHNRLPVGTSIHWHGMDVPPAMDGPVGLNQAAVGPGDDFVYEFTADNVGSRWYHAHADPKVQIALGLYGPLVVDPREPETAYDREYTYMTNEWDLELTPDVALGTAPIGPRDAHLRGGELGTDLFLLNGRAHESIPPIELAEGERVLIRLMNAGNLPHAIHSHGHSFTIVATDGNPVPEAARLVKDTVLIGPGERYDLELTGDNPGVWMFHCHMEHHADNGMMTLIEYDGAVPTGPVAPYWTAGGKADAMDHGGGHHGPAAPPALADPIATPEPATAPEPTATPAPTPTEPAPPSAGTEETVVTLVDDRFSPAVVEIPAGTVVTFVNRGANWHSVAALDGSWESGRIEPGGAYSVRLDTPGEVRYICQHHVLRGMTGRVTVQ